MASGLPAAARFLREHARPLELRAFECLFEGAPHAAFVAALAAFRRDDGGFGNALEPDARAPESQPLFVDYALKSLHQVGARASELGAGACAFLRSASEPDGALPWLLPSALAHPRAAHWETLRPPALELTYGIAALLHWLGVEDPWLDTATETCWSALGEPPEEAHALIGVLHFLEYAPARPERDARLAHVREIVPRARWLSLAVPVEGYALTPLDIAPRPDDLARTCFDDATIEAHLDALAARQQADGGWPLSWDPPGEAARAEWRGKWTLDALAILRAYGRI